MMLSSRFSGVNRPTDRVLLSLASFLVAGLGASLITGGGTLALIWLCTTGLATMTLVGFGMACLWQTDPAKPSALFPGFHTFLYAQDPDGPSVFLRNKGGDGVLVLFVLAMQAPWVLICGLALITNTPSLAVIFGPFLVWIALLSVAGPALAERMGAVAYCLLSLVFFSCWLTLLKGLSLLPMGVALLFPLGGFLVGSFVSHAMSMAFHSNPLFKAGAGAFVSVVCGVPLLAVIPAVNPLFEDASWFLKVMGVLITAAVIPALIPCKPIARAFQSLGLTPLSPEQCQRALARLLMDSRMRDQSYPRDHAQWRTTHDSCFPFLFFGSLAYIAAHPTMTDGVVFHADICDEKGTTVESFFTECLPNTQVSCAEGPVVRLPQTAHDTMAFAKIFHLDSKTG